MAKEGGRYFRQMEPYEKQHRNTKAMASLKNGEKLKEDKVWSSAVVSREIQRLVNEDMEIRLMGQIGVKVIKWHMSYFIK